MATVTGTSLDDVLHTTADADTASAGNGNDFILIGSGAHDAGERIAGGSGYDRIWFTSGVIGDTLNLLPTVTQVEAVFAADVAGRILGTTNLNINAGAVLVGLEIVGNEGDNVLTGTSRNDVIVGNGGLDTIIAGAGADRVVIRIDEATLDAADGGVSSAEGNTLEMVGTAAGDIVIDLTVAAGVDQLQSIDGVNEVRVQSDFTHVNAARVLGGGVAVTGTAITNTLVGSAQNDTITGGGGIDLLSGLAGDDIFLIASGLDHHSKNEAIGGGQHVVDVDGDLVGDGDVIRFTNANPLVGHTLFLSAKVTGIEKVQIADAAGDTSGTTVLHLNASRVANGLIIDGNDGANNIVGTAKNDTITGNGGADTIAGGLGEDRYVVGSGTQATVADRITDIGGTSDYIVFTSQTGGDTLVIGNFVTGIEAVYLSEDPTEDDLALDGTTALNVNASAVLNKLTAFKFLGNDGANSLVGGAGNDTFEGGGGTDTLMGGGGADLVVMDAAALDAADGGSAADAGGNTLRLTGTAGALITINLQLEGDAFDQIAADGPIQADFTHIDASEMEGFGVRVTASGRTNNLVGSAQDDFFVYTSGLHRNLDSIDGGEHELDPDGKLLNKGDIIRFASLANNDELVLTSSMEGIETVQISDADGVTTGTARVHVDATLMSGPISMEGNDGANRMRGTSGDDTLNGNGGVDTLFGGSGSDVYEIDSLADYVGGDTITDEDGAADTILFSSEIDGDDLVLNATISGIEKFSLGEEEGFAFDTGIDAALLRYGAKFIGNEGDNTFVGSNFDDTIEGGLGVDTITGGTGADRIVMNMDGPADIINAGLKTEGNWLLFKAPEDLEVNGIVVDMRLGNGVDQVTSEAGMQTGFLHLDASGLTFPGDPDLPVFDWTIDVTGGNEANHFIGSSMPDRFTGGLGADTIEGGVGPHGDAFVVRSQAEYDGDVYSDSGSTTNDYIFFDSNVDGQELTIRNNVFGVDAAAAGAHSGTTTDLHLDARQVNQPFGLQGNMGDNHLRSTIHGESLFDVGGADTMEGWHGSDDYTILSFSGWINDDPNVNNDKFDIINDTGTTIDDFYFADEFSGATLVVGKWVKGVERFAITGADLSEGGPFVRDNTTTNNAGLDASAVNNAIILGGNDGNNRLVATKFNDTIEGFLGRDTIIAGTGTDIITMDVTDGIIDEIHAGAETENNVLVLKGENVALVNFDLAASDQLTGFGDRNDPGFDFDDILQQNGIVHVEAAQVTGDFGILVFGNTRMNRIIGTAQDDVIEGHDGRDTLEGGDGNDVFVVRNLAHLDTGEVADGGAGDNDQVWFAWGGVGQMLFRPSAMFRNFEVLVAADDTGDTTGTDAIVLDASLQRSPMKLIGNDGNNRLVGTGREDTLTGNLGADTLVGGAGNDVYLYNDTGAMTALEQIADSKGLDVLRFTAAADFDVLTLAAGISGIEVAELSDEAGDLTGIARTGINASALAATRKLQMRGNEGANTLTGGAGNDTLVGNGGNDSIVGGLGADVVEMGAEANTLDDVNAGAVAEGNTLVMKGNAAGNLVFDLSAVDQLVTINNVDEGRTVAGITHLDLSEVEGGAATITGTAEANRLIGTALDDTFIVLETAHFGVNEIITGGEGSDELVLTATQAGTWLLTARVTGIESVVVDTAAPVNIAVNAAAIRNALKIEGNDGNNLVTGTVFGDTIIGGLGADTIMGGKGADKITSDLTQDDAINAGALAEQNEWALQGAAAATLVVNLALAGDQLAGGLVQSGFMHFDASEVTGFGANITGSAGANRIAGTAQQDTINGGLGADVISMDVTSTYDAINGGAVAEGNELRLTGTAGGTHSVDLSAGGDQVSTGTQVQTGFMHFDASDLAGAGVNVTGSSGANRITGSAQQDTIAAGAGADIVTMDVTGAVFDALDAGAGSEGDTLVLVGNAGNGLTIDLGVAAGADQITNLGAGAEAVVQSDFQHVDASGLEGGFQLVVRGSNANNAITGTQFQDRITGRGGADRIDLGANPDTGDSDGEEDHVIYEALSDGMNYVAAGISQDRIVNFDEGQDRFVFRAEFNGGTFDLDDIQNNNGFQFIVNGAADFTEDHEALLVTAAVSKLKDGQLFSGGLSKVAKVVTRQGITAEVGDDALLVVQGKTSTGIYYYQEMGGAGVQGSELTLLGIADTHVGNSDFLFV